MSSAGVVLTNTFGTCEDVSVWPGTAALTSVQLPLSSGSILKPAGSFAAGFHAPLTSGAVSQELLYRRYSVLLAVVSWNRSQFVFTANLRSLPLIGLQIGSPSRFTRTARLVL